MKMPKESKKKNLCTRRGENAGTNQDLGHLSEDWRDRFHKKLTWSKILRDYQYLPLPQEMKVKKMWELCG